MSRHRADVIHPRALGVACLTAACVWAVMDWALSLVLPDPSRPWVPHAIALVLASILAAFAYLLACPVSVDPDEHDDEHGRVWDLADLSGDDRPWHNRKPTAQRKPPAGPMLLDLDDAHCGFEERNLSARLDAMWQARR